MDLFDALLNDPQPGIFATSAAVAALILIPMIAEAKAGTFSVWSLKTVFLVFILLQFSVWPVMMYVPKYTTLFITELTFWNTRYPTFMRGQYAVIAGLLAFYAGFYRSTKLRIAPLLPWTSRSVSITDRQYLKLYWACFAVNALAFGAMMVSSGGIVYFVQNIDTLRTTQGAGWGQFLFPIIACQVGFTLFVARWMQARYPLTLPLIALAAQLGCAFVLGIRMFLVAPIVSFLVCYHFQVRPLRLTARGAFALVGFIVFNMWYAVFRGTGKIGLDAVSDIPADVFVIGFFGRFHGGESMARIIEYTDRADFHYGILNVQDFLLSFVPRALMADKPVSIGTVANVTFWPESFTLTDTGSAVITLFGELYWAFGIPLVLVGLYLHGVAFRRAEREDNARTPVRTTVYCLMYVYALFVNESLSLHFFQLVFRYLALAGILWVFARGRARRRSVEFSAALPPLAQGG